MPSVATLSTSGTASPIYFLHYPSASPLEPSYAFPCDESGLVDIDLLSESQRNHYFYARVVSGNAIGVPRVVHLNQAYLFGTGSLALRDMLAR